MPYLTQKTALLNDSGGRRREEGGETIPDRGKCKGIQLGKQFCAYRNQVKCKKKKKTGKNKARPTGKSWVNILGYIFLKG